MSDAASWLQVLPVAPRFILQGPSEALAAVDQALGLPADETPCRARSNERATLLWLGPDERLIIAPAQDAGLESLLRTALAALPHSLVDVSHRQVAYRLDSRHAEDLLNCGCPQDLDLAQFPIGMCSRTLFNKTEIVLWRRDPSVFHIEVWRSFAPYLEGWLREAVQDLG